MEDFSTLLLGETGTGKGAAAQAIGRSGFIPLDRRRKIFVESFTQSFVSLNLSQFPETLIESALFGHKKGAFTGANTDRKGLFFEANGGTIFLDEINNLPIDMQSKLLRVLEDEKVRPIGSNISFPMDVRIIAASSVPLKALVDQNKFREDLFYRLYVYPIYIPLLEERKRDIPLLANHFLTIYADKQNKKITHFHEDIIDFIKQRKWKGNIRELVNFVERMVTLTPENNKIVTNDHLPADLKDEFELYQKQKKSTLKKLSLKAQVDNYESKLIKQALIDSEWNQSEAARRLKTSEKNIRYKMEKFSIQNPIK